MTEQKHFVIILWGDSPDPEDTPNTYSFDTKAELDAFMMGIAEGDGWMGHQVLEDSREPPTPIDQLLKGDDNGSKSD